MDSKSINIYMNKVIQLVKRAVMVIKHGDVSKRIWRKHSFRLGGPGRLLGGGDI